MTTAAVVSDAGAADNDDAPIRLVTSRVMEKLEREIKIKKRTIACARQMSGARRGKPKLLDSSSMRCKRSTAHAGSFDMTYQRWYHTPLLRSGLMGTPHAACRSVI